MRQIAASNPIKLDFCHVRTIPRARRSLLHLAVDLILKHIRYTGSLATSHIQRCLQIIMPEYCAKVVKVQGADHTC